MKNSNFENGEAKSSEADGSKLIGAESDLAPDLSSVRKKKEQKAAHPGLVSSIPDPFADLSKLRISQNFNETVGVKKAILHIPVRKPTKQEFIRVHPDESMRLPAAMIDLKEEQEIFLVSPNLIPLLPGAVVPKLLVTAINRQGILFVWPIGLDLDEGRIRKNHWNETARTAADLATKGWVKVAANMSLGSYEVFEASGKLPDPEWSALSFQEILKVAFKDNIITSMDHIVIRKLLGEV